MTKEQYIAQYYHYVQSASEHQKQLLQKIMIEQTSKVGSTFKSIVELIESGYFSWLPLH